MKLPATIVYRNLEASDALNEKIQRRVNKLLGLCEQLCVQRVVINAPHHHQHKGNALTVSLELNQAGKALNLSHSHDQAHLAVRELFNTAERVVKEQSARLRTQRHTALDKHHELDLAS